MSFDKNNPFADTLVPEKEALTNLVYWYPVLLPTGIPMPETAIVYAGDIDLAKLPDGEIPERWPLLEKRLKLETDRLGYPCFIKTGVLSDKHSWKHSCFLEKPEDLLAHVGTLVESSFMANIVGKPFDFSFFVIRKMIETDPVFKFFHGEMPITKEVRVFIDGGEIACIHPYWPAEAFRGSINEEEVKILQDFTEEQKAEVAQMAKFVAKMFSGFWSVDFLLDKKGKWWLIDMATGGESYHWPDCPSQKKDAKI